MASTNCSARSDGPTMAAAVSCAEPTALNCSASSTLPSASTHPPVRASTSRHWIAPSTASCITLQEKMSCSESTVPTA